MHEVRCQCEHTATAHTTSNTAHDSRCSLCECTKWRAALRRWHWQTAGF